MRPASLLSLIGFITLIAATYCPMLRPFHLMNWNVYKLNQPYGMVIMLVGVIGILCTVLNQAKVTRIAAWASLVLVVLLFIAAILKVKTTFSFIPFRGINGFLTKQIAFKWGWYVLFAGAGLSVIGALASKKRIYTEGK
jgi:predicted membrane channel-forming protein YqfA (hemolysin III family)